VPPLRWGEGGLGALPSVDSAAPRADCVSLDAVYVQCGPRSAVSESVVVAVALWWWRLTAGLPRRCGTVIIVLDRRHPRLLDPPQ
jgi:hypothetical protein